MAVGQNSRGNGAANAPVSDLERDACRDGIYNEDSSEETPLLPTDLPSDIVPKKSVQYLVTAMGILSLLVVTVSQSVLSPAGQEILEDVICHKVYPDHPVGEFTKPDPRCKDNSVGETLAMVRAWDASAEMLVPMFVQLLYGIIADKYGRKIVLFLALFGCCLQITWQLVVLWFPQRFDVWCILYGNIAFLIGGGGQVAVAMIYTIFSDVIPVAQRTNVFYLASAILRVVSVAATPLAAKLLEIHPWLAVRVGYGLLLSGTACVFFIPETLSLRQRADNRMRRNAESGHDNVSDVPMAKKLSAKSIMHQALFSMQNDMTHVWRFLLGSKDIMLLIAASAIHFPLVLALIVDLLQYMGKRFGWSWATSTYVLSIEKLTGVVVLMAILPAASWTLGRAGYTPLRRDLLLARASAVFAFVGITVIAFAPFGALCIVGLVIFSFGSGFSALFRGLICAVVEPHTLGTLNTAIAMTESLMGLASSPVLGWLLAKGLKLGGMWQGLSFMVAAAMGGIAVVLMFVFKLPAAFARS